MEAVCLRLCLNVPSIKTCLSTWTGCLLCAQQSRAWGIPEGSTQALLDEPRALDCRPDGALMLFQGGFGHLWGWMPGGWGVGRFGEPQCLAQTLY